MNNISNITDNIFDQLNSIRLDQSNCLSDFSYYGFDTDINGEGIMAVSPGHYNKLKGLIKKCLDIFDELNYSDEEIENIRKEFRNYE
jgi:hypothetical protein